MLRFTRHARNRMRLFGIAAEEVTAVWSSPERREAEGDLVRCFGRVAGKYAGKALLVVVDAAVSPPVVVTVYPYKGRWRRA